VEGVYDMTESPFVNSFIDKGKLEERRKSLLELLDGRFPGSVTNEVRQMIQFQDSYGILSDWFRATIRINSFEEFMSLVKQ